MGTSRNVQTHQLCVTMFNVPVVASRLNSIHPVSMAVTVILSLSYPPPTLSIPPFPPFSSPPGRPPASSAAGPTRHASMAPGMWRFRMARSLLSHTHTVSTSSASWRRTCSVRAILGREAAPPAIMAFKTSVPPCNGPLGTSPSSGVTPSKCLSWGSLPGATPCHSIW